MGSRVYQGNVPNATDGTATFLATGGRLGGLASAVAVVNGYIQIEDVIRKYLKSNKTKHSTSAL